jgi:integrase/recombinase XerD
MIMETEEGPGCVLLAEFRGWLDRERGLSPASVRCYSKQSKAFLAGIGGAGAVSELNAGKVTAFIVDWTQGRNTWSAKAMVTSLRPSRWRGRSPRSRRGGCPGCPAA